MADFEPIQRRKVQPRPKDVINLKLMTLGDVGVGKSTLVHSFCADGDVVLEAGEPTVGADFKVKMLKHAGKDFRVNIWDASGDLKFIDVRNEFYKEAQGVVLVFDVTSKRSFQNLEKWTDEVTRYAQGSEPIYAVVGTKTDLHPRLVQEQVARDWAKSRGMPYFEASGAQGRNVEMVFKELASRLS
ncbi:rab1B [Symbiodinium sp. CCMP2592]|nr:rab1B [Symbiodinium sp. CCMP2592]